MFTQRLERKSESLSTGHCMLPCPGMDHQERCPCPAGIRAPFFHWNSCLALQAQLSSFATSLISSYDAFDRLAANASINCKDFSLSLLLHSSLSSPIAPALSGPVSPFTVSDGVRPHLSSQPGDEIISKPDRRFITPPPPTFLFYPIPLFLWIWTLHIIFIQQGLESTHTPPHTIILLIGAGAKGTCIFVGHTLMLLWANLYLQFLLTDRF